MNPVLRMSSVCFGYGPDLVLDDISIEIEPGEGVALLGANGAGKTTITRLAMAMRHPSHGHVETVGISTDGAGPEDLAGTVGYVFQNPEAQLVERSVRAEIGFGPRQLGWADSRMADATTAVLEELRLTDVAEVHPYDLPAARRRLVALASALVTGPRFLILDEPTTGLDRTGRQAVIRVLRARRYSGCAVLAVSHDTDFAVEVLDRALVLRDRHIVRDDTVERVLADGERLGLPLPPAAELARGLSMPVASWRAADVASALAQRCRASGPSVS